jgi:predicted TIM-barrel fold metal-dependent hydrolase
MEAAGIDVAVLQPVATRPDQVCSINDWTAGLAGDHIVPFGAMHPDFEGVAEEFARMRSIGIRGVKLHPEFQLCAPEDPRMHPIYEAANAEGLIILFHAGIDIAIDTLTGTPDVFSRIHEAYPDLRMVLAHLGGFRMWDEVREHLVGRDVWLDTSYTLGHLPDAEFVEIVRAHGVDRILFGTDAPWGDMAEDVRKMGELGFSDAELEAIMHGSAEALLSR